MNCTRCNKRLSRKTARLIDGKVLCSTCMFGGDLAHVKGCSLKGIPYQLASCGCRDSDRYREADETGTGSVPEGDRARAEGIAQPLPVPPHKDHP